MTETIVEYNARCKSWGDDIGGYRDQQVGTAWPAPPADPANGGAWASFLDTDCGTPAHVGYREWREGWQPVPSPEQPPASGGVIGRGPPPGPPAKRG